MTTHTFWAEYCPCCGLTFQAWEGCTDAFHSSLNTRSIQGSMGAQVDPGDVSASRGRGQKPE